MGTHARMTVSFDKKLAELDAYLQMLIEQNETLDKKLESATSEKEKDGLVLIKNNLETLLSSIKHAIVLLQISKVSIKTQAHQPKYTVKDGAAVVPDQGGHDGIDDDDDDSFYDAADEQSIKLNATAPHSADILNSLDIEKSVTNPIDELSTSPKMTDDTKFNSVEDGTIDWDALYDEEEEDLGSLENQGSVIKHLMSQIRIGMDLTKVVLPTFILERRSLLEMYADFFAHPDLFSNIPDYETPEERMVQLVRWYLSAFHAGRKSSVAKKPYNPILGEIFLCHWNLDSNNNDNSSAQKRDELQNSKESSPVDDINKFSSQLPQNSLMFIAEQVSHHPPVSAFYAENADKDIYCCAHIYTKSKYLGLSVGVHNIGEGVIRLMKHNETYVCTFPSAYGRSILTVPWVELGGSINISCEETGYTANIEFITKPFYGGKKHRVIGEILRPNKEPFMSIDGEWNGVMFKKIPPNSSDKQVFVDTSCLPVIRKHVRSISSQESFESRNVWKEVTRALKLRDVVDATAAKSFIEQRQRDLLKDRTEKGLKWKTRYFEPKGEGWTFANPLAVRKSIEQESN